MSKSDNFNIVITFRSSSHYFLKQTNISFINNYSEIFQRVGVSSSHTDLIENKIF